MAIQIIDVILLIICLIIIIRQKIALKAFEWFFDFADKLEATPTETMKMLDKGHSPQELLEYKKQLDEEKAKTTSSNKLDRIGF